MHLSQVYLPNFCFGLFSRLGTGNLFIITCRIKCRKSLARRKYCLILPSTSTFIFPRNKERENYVKEREMRLLTHCLHYCLSWSFVLTRCCVLTWVMKILMRVTLNVHADRRFLTPSLDSRVVFSKLRPPTQIRPT